MMVPTNHTSTDSKLGKLLVLTEKVAVYLIYIGNFLYICKEKTEMCFNEILINSV